MRKLLMLLSTLVIIAALAVVVLFFKLNTLVQAGIERYGSEIAGVPVKLAMADISPMSGSGSLTSFSIGNPPGFKADEAFKAAKISVKIDKESLKTDTIIVQEMTIDSPHIDYELAGNSNNFAIIRENIQKNLRAHPDFKDDSVLDDKVIVISDLYIKHGSINVTAPILANNEVYKVVLPDIHLQNLGKGDKPGNLPEIMQKIMMILTGDVMSAVGPVTLKNFDKMVTQGGIINPVNDVQKAVEGVGQTIDNIIPR